MTYLVASTGKSTADDEPLGLFHAYLPTGIEDDFLTVCGEYRGDLHETNWLFDVDAANACESCVAIARAKPTLDRP